MKIVAITQARVGSTRLPAKVLKRIQDKTLLQIHLERILKSKLIDDLIVATTHETGVDQICQITELVGAKCFKGSTDDVLDRFYQSVKGFGVDWVIRLTSDCPLIDPDLIDEVVNLALESDADYCANILIENFPDGQDIEVFKMSALERAWREATSKSDREHVTPYIRSNTDFKGGNIFKGVNYNAPSNFNKIRMTVDEPADFEMMAWLIESLGTGKSWLEYTEFMLQNPDHLVNADIIRNEGYLKSKD
ncbi:cytidylyltransferase domain-containing protein [Roseivirga sp.]|uniref:cytidylyltransferase domain-containing protein n=1 Tax=Roseivirga sp. TaxID=1964215 RepID=UPI003B524DAA